VIGVSKFVFAMIFLVGFVCAFFGVLIYEAFLKEVEVRTVLLFNVIANVIVTFLQFSFAMRWNQEVDVDDMFMIFFTDAGIGTLSTAFLNLPSMALFAKISPRRIEATLFALLTSVMNLDTYIL